MTKIATKIISIILFVFVLLSAVACTATSSTSATISSNTSNITKTTSSDSVGIDTDTTSSIPTILMSTISPFQIMLTYQGAGHEINSPINNTISQAIANLVNNLGSPLSAAEVSEYQSTWADASDAITLMAVYSPSIKLYSTNGSLLASAGLVVIQWDRGDNEPNRLFYGINSTELFDGIYRPQQTFDGGFEIKGSISALNQAVSSLIPAVVNGTLIVTSTNP